jgi:hypothetical protein
MYEVYSIYYTSNNLQFRDFLLTYMYVEIQDS